MSKLFICTGTWRRNNKGDIISESDYNRMPIEAKKNNYIEYVQVQSPKKQVDAQEIEAINIPTQVGNLSDLKKSWRDTLKTDD